MSETSATPTKPTGMSPIQTVEQICCPSCESTLSQTDYSRTTGEHPKLHTITQTIKTDCPHCGARKTARFILRGGVWQLDGQVHDTPRNRRPTSGVGPGAEAA